MENQSRGQFIKTLGLSTKALMAYYCLGATLSSCTKEEETVLPTPTPTPNATGVTGSSSGTIDFTLDLKNANFSKLTTDGEFVIVGDVLVANAAGTYVAVSKACTHAGTTLSYRKADGDFWCSNHNSEFKIDGSVKKAPATTAIKKYNAAFDSAKNILKVS